MSAIQEIIKQKENEAFKFSPSPDFYKVIGINRRRWGQVFRGEIDPTVGEVNRIAQYFDVPVMSLISKN